ncbi:MAG: NUDIX domain-containing protein [Oligoflexia bacterium]|nr:NUDIX domain-containing protein [Oligoflexia bacterium]
MNTISLTVDAVVICFLKHREPSVLLVERKYPPYARKLALPGGFVDANEAPPSAIVRELKEETSLDISPSQVIPLKARGATNRDPRGPTVTIPFLVILEQNDLPVINGGDDASMATWQSLSEIEELAFDHGAILCEAVASFWKWPTIHGLNFQVDKNHKMLGPSEGLYQSTEETIFFGGTFDPLHQGHLACIKLCPNPERVIVVPDKNPFKPLGSALSLPTSCAWASYKLLSAKLKDIPCWVYPGFCGLEHTNPTSTWIKYFPQSYSLLVGDDVFLDLPKWHKVTSFINQDSNLKKIYVAPRNGDNSLIKQTIDWAQKLHPQLQIIRLAEHPYQTISSSCLRVKS